MTQNGPSMSTHCRKRPGIRTLERRDFAEIVENLRRSGFEGEKAIAWLREHGNELYPRNDLQKLLQVLQV